MIFCLNKLTKDLILEQIIEQARPAAPRYKNRRHIAEQHNRQNSRRRAHGGRTRMIFCLNKLTKDLIPEQIIEQARLSAPACPVTKTAAVSQSSIIGETPAAALMEDAPV